MEKNVRVFFGECGDSVIVKIHTKEEMALLKLLTDVGAVDYDKLDKGCYDTKDYLED